jgi:hypothetical protein
VPSIAFLQVKLYEDSADDAFVNLGAAAMARDPSEESGAEDPNPDAAAK